MNDTLRRLLIQAGHATASSERAWANIVVLNNFGGIPVPSGLPADSSREGFKLLLVDERGAPTGFVTCGREDDPAFESQTRIIEALSALPELSRVLPRTRGAAGGGLRIQLAAYVPGTPYLAISEGQSPDEWAQSVVEILDVAELAARHAADMKPPRSERGALAGAAAPLLARLQQAGFPTPYLEVLDRVFRAIQPLPRRLQHGDLWPANVIRYKDSWWLIDFAEFGNVDVPMYDVWHMSRHTGPAVRATSRATRPLSGTTGVNDAWTSAVRQVIASRADALGLSVEEVAATKLYYLLHMAWYRLRHGVNEMFREQHVHELLLAAESLSTGASVDRVLTP